MEGERRRERGGGRWEEGKGEEGEGRRERGRREREEEGGEGRE